MEDDTSPQAGTPAQEPESPITNWKDPRCITNHNRVNGKEQLDCACCEKKVNVLHWYYVIDYFVSLFHSLPLRLSLYLSDYFSTYLFACLSVCLSVCLSIYLSVCPSVSVSLSLPLGLFLSLLNMVADQRWEIQIATVSACPNPTRKVNVR